MTLETVREYLMYNKQVDEQIEQVRVDAEMEVLELEQTKIEVDELMERQIGLCDWFRSSRWYKTDMTDQEIIDRYNKNGGRL